MLLQFELGFDTIYSYLGKQHRPLDSKFSPNPNAQTMRASFAARLMPSSGAASGGRPPSARWTNERTGSVCG